MGLKARQLFPLLGGSCLIMGIVLLSSSWQQVQHEVYVRELSSQAVRVQTEKVHQENAVDVTSPKDRILFMVLTAPTNLDKKAVNVKDTWGKRADKVIFISSVTNTSFPTVGVDVPEGRDHLTAKTNRGFAYAVEHHLDDAEWFMKCDDDTYVIVENLKKFLSDKNSSELVYFGHLFQTKVKQGYYSGGAGYVFSKAALKHWYHNGGRDPDVCTQDGGSEDVEIGLCMEKLGIKTHNTTDAQGGGRFLPFDPDRHILGPFSPWYHVYDVHGGQKGIHTINEYAISFHYMDRQRMLLMELLLYKMKRWGEYSQNYML